MPNSLSYLVLFGWPVVVFVLFRTLPRAQALCWSILGGYLLLPIGVGINLPVLPRLDKTFIPSVSSGLFCLILADAGIKARSRRQGAAAAGSSAGPSASSGMRAGGRAERGRMAASGPALSGPSLSDPPLPPAPGPGFTRARGRRPEEGASRAPDRQMGQDPDGSAAAPRGEGVLRLPRPILAMGILLGVNIFLTLVTNLEPYRVGGRTIQGLRLYDALASVQTEAILILPYMLGAVFLARPDQNRTLLRVLCVLALAYSLLTLWEIRMSPQLNRTFYGYLAQPFLQAMRDGGFRPVVFLQHGLWLAIFNVMAALGAFALWRNEGAAGRKAKWALWTGLWLSGVLVLSNSLGALIILVLLAPVVLFFPHRLQLILAAVLAAILMLYPILRGSGIIPTQAAYELARSISEDRADSLRFRLTNEDILLAHANESPISGWGGYGRSRVYDPETGEDISTTDGMWVIIMGGTGWLGYIAKYGLLGLPVILLALRRRLEGETFVVTGLALLLVANMVDMIANATLTPVTWLVAGALAGRAGLQEATAPQLDAPERRRSRQSRGRNALKEAA